MLEFLVYVYAHGKDMNMMDYRHRKA